MSESFDVIVIGGGPAGLSAALWLGRYRAKTCVVDSGEYRNVSVDEVHGYLGMDCVSPMELLEAARRDLKRYKSVQIVQSRVTDVARGAEGFEVTAGDSVLHSSRLLLATGVVDALPDIAGIQEHYGSSVFHCPMCDGFETRGRNVVVIGWSNRAATLASTIAEWAKSVVLVTDGEQLRANHESRETLESKGVRVIEDEAVELIGDRGKLSSMKMRHSSDLECDVAFFSTGNCPAPEIPDLLGLERDEQGSIKVDDSGRTSVDGVYAAGDMTPGPHLIQVAAAKGTVAAAACAESLFDL